MTAKRPGSALSPTLINRVWKYFTYNPKTNKTT